MSIEWNKEFMIMLDVGGTKYGATAIALSPMRRVIEHAIKQYA